MEEALDLLSGSILNNNNNNNVMYISVLIVKDGASSVALPSVPLFHMMTVIMCVVETCSRK